MKAVLVIATLLLTQIARAECVYSTADVNGVPEKILSQKGYTIVDGSETQRINLKKLGRVPQLWEYVKAGMKEGQYASFGIDDLVWLVKVENGKLWSMGTNSGRTVEEAYQGLPNCGEFDPQWKKPLEQ